MGPQSISQFRTDFSHHAPRHAQQGLHSGIQTPRPQKYSPHHSRSLAGNLYLGEYLIFSKDSAPETKACAAGSNFYSEQCFQLMSYHCFWVPESIRHVHQNWHQDLSQIYQLEALRGDFNAKRYLAFLYSSPSPHLDQYHLLSKAG